MYTNDAGRLKMRYWPEASIPCQYINWIWYFFVWKCYKNSESVVLNLKKQIMGNDQYSQRAKIVSLLQKKVKTLKLRVFWANKNGQLSQKESINVCCIRSELWDIQFQLQDIKHGSLSYFIRLNWKWETTNDRKCKVRKKTSGFFKATTK